MPRKNENVLRPRRDPHLPPLRLSESGGNGQLDKIVYLWPFIKPTGAVCIFTRWDVQQKIIDKMTACGMKPKNVLIWDKVAHGMGDLRRAFASRYESAIFYAAPDFRFNGKRPQDIVRCRKVPPCKLTHPNEKPAQLMEMLIEPCTAAQDYVLDCFMGSGSTGVACLRTGRHFIGIEKDPNYFQIAKERLDKERETLTNPVAGGQ